MNLSIKFSGLLRVVRVENYRSGSFRATATHVNSTGDIVDRQSLYYLKSSHSAMGTFFEEGQVWNVTGTDSVGEVELASGYKRRTHLIQPLKAQMVRPSGKHLVWHFTHSDWYPGIGKNKALSLVEHLSDRNGHDELYEALDNADVTLLASAPLITQWDAEVIARGWSQYGSTKVLSWFEENYIDTGLGKKVFEFHREKTLDAISDNPYILTSFNIPFAQVDELAQRSFLVKRDDSRRLDAAATEVLWEQFTKHGHTRIKLCEYIKLMSGYLGGDLEHVVKAHSQVIESTRAVIRGDFVHQFEAAIMETVVANRVTDLLATDYTPPLDRGTIDQILSQVMLEVGYSLTEEQEEAVSRSLHNPFSIITGGAGVGKTTVLKALYRLYDAAGIKRIQLAISGRAAQRMFEATDEEAQTIAGYLHHFDWGSVPELQRSKTVIVIDEASMVDIHSMYQVVKKTPKDVHLILIGDPFQLPPVGGGLVLHELVDLECLPVSRLSVVKRQGKSSSIPVVATDIRTGKPPKTLGDDVELIESPSTHVAQRAIEEYLKAPGTSQILCAQNKLVAIINGEAQSLLNPGGQEVHYRLEGEDFGTGVRCGDPVICTANLYRAEYDLRNGSMGRVLEVYERPRPLEVKTGKSVKTIASYGAVVWDDGTETGYRTELPFEVIQSIQLAYAITVHKSQGSQFKNAIFAATRSAGLDRTLVYTAVTRASQRALIIGDLKAVNRAILEPPHAHRRSVALGSFVEDRLP
jgi:exodeoxyribonuclease V alpha subunit